MGSTDDNDETETKAGAEQSESESESDAQSESESDDEADDESDDEAADEAADEADDEAADGPDDGPDDEAESKSEWGPKKPTPKPGMRVDPLGLSALLSYILVGGFLVFGFAWAILPAVEAQNASPCRPLRPEAREGAAPSFEVQDLQGNPVNLQSFAGQFVVLNFWATWCEPCISEWPQVHRLAERLADDGSVTVVALSIDNDRDAIYPFLERMAMARNIAPEGKPPKYELTTDVVVLWDPKQEVHKTFGTEKIPDTYFIDEVGDLVHAFINVRSWGSPDALHCVDSLSG